MQPGKIYTPGRRRTFSHHAECWYADAIDEARRSTETDHVSIVLGEDPEGGIDYEFRIAWLDIGRGPAAAQLQIFDESWLAFSECADLFAWLARQPGDIQPPALIAGLIALGFEDTTPRERNG